MSLADAVASATANWPLNEASGTRADSIGAVDLTDSNTVGSAAGLFGTAADFEFDNDERLFANDAASISVGDIDFCWVAWIKPETVDGNLHWILAQGNTTTSANIPYSLNITTANKARFLVGNGAGSFTEVVSSETLSAGNTYLIVAYHDSVNNLIGISVNGGAFATAACSHGSFNSSAAIVFGDITSTGGVFNYDGLIEDVTLLKNYILDDAEVDELYNAGAGVAFADWAAGGGITADVPVAAVAYGANVPTSAKSAAAPLGLADYAAVAPASAKTAGLTPAAVETAAVTPAASKSATAPQAACETVAHAPSAAKSVAAPLAAVEYAGLAPERQGFATAPLGTCEYAAVVPASSKAAGVPVGGVEYVGVSPTSSIDTAEVPVIIRSEAGALYEHGSAAWLLYEHGSAAWLLYEHGSAASKVIT